MATTPPSTQHFELAKNGAESDLAKVTSASPASPVNYDVVGDNNWALSRCCMRLMDGSIRPSKFGGATALTNGIRVVMLDDAGDEVIDYLDGLTIKKNADWALLAGPDQPVTNDAGDGELIVRWTLSKATGGKLIKMPAEYKLRFIIQDPLNAVSEFHIMAQGMT